MFDPGRNSLSGIKTPPNTQFAVQVMYVQPYILTRP